MFRLLLLCAPLWHGILVGGSQSSVTERVSSELERVLEQLSQTPDDEQAQIRQLASRGLELLGSTPKPLGEARLRFRLGRIELNDGDAGAAIGQFTLALELARPSGDDALRVRIHNSLGSALRLAGQTNKALTEIEAGLALARLLGRRDLQVESLIRLGTLSSDLGDFAKAIEYGSLALEMHGESGAVLVRVRLLNNIGIAFSSAGQPERALEFHDQALQLVQGKDSLATCTTLIDLGTCMGQLQEYEEALSYFEEAAEMAELLNEPSVLNIALMNAGVIHAQTGQSKKAVEILEPVAQWLRDRDRKHDLVIALIALGISQENLNDEEAGTSALQEARRLAQASSAADLEIGVVSALAATYASMSSFEHAFECASEVLFMMQEESRAHQVASLAEFEARYEAQEREQVILSLKNDSQVREVEVARMAQQRTSLVMLTTLSAASCLGLFLLGRSRHRNHVALVATTQDLSSNRDQLQTALDEVATLRGLLPICAHCRSIRDEAGKWSVLEEYISERTGATFSHGICPPCLETNYGLDVDGNEIAGPQL